MKRVIIYITLFCLITIKGVGQSYFSNRLFLNNNESDAIKFKFFNDTFYVPGSIIYYSPYTTKGVLMKVANSGTELPIIQINHSGKAYTGFMDIERVNKNYYVSVITGEPNVVQSCFAKLKSNGDTIFSKIYGDTSYYFYGYKLLRHAAQKNKLLIIGGTDSTCGLNHPGKYKLFVRVLDTNGVLYQTKIYLSSCLYRNFYHAEPTKDKGYLIPYAETNFMNVYNTGSINNLQVLKLDSNLNLAWNKYIDTGQNVNAGVVSLKKGGFIYGSAKTDSFSFGMHYQHLFLAKYDDNGNLKWRKFYGNKIAANAITALKELPNGDLIVTGARAPNNYTPLRGFLMRTDSLGNIKWWKHYLPDNPVADTTAQNYLYDVLQMPDGNIAAVGYAGSSTQFNTKTQTWLLKTDSNGCYISGCAVGVGIEELEENKEMPHFNAYPNPFNNELNVSYTLLNEESEGLLTIVEMGSGRIMIQQALKQNKDLLKFSTSSLSAGMYLISITQKNYPSKYVKLVNIK